jgi:Domain of unknown function (DUF6457)
MLNLNLAEADADRRWPPDGRCNPDEPRTRSSDVRARLRRYRGFARRRPRLRTRAWRSSSIRSERSPRCLSVTPTDPESEVGSTVANRRDEVIDALAEHVGTPPLTAAEIEAVLVLAAVAAHGSGDRTTAPLASFLAGVAAAATEDRITLLDELRRHVAELTATPGQ